MGLVTLQWLLDRSEIVSSPGGCWLWNGARTTYGYGSMTKNRKRYYIHRVAYELFCGPLLSGEMVCHTCDTPACWCPSHLFKGASFDNVNDMLRKGRMSKPPVHWGETHHKAKLTEEDVVAIRRLRDTGEFTFTELGKLFGVSKTTTRYIISRRIWRHVP